MQIAMSSNDIDLIMQITMTSSDLIDRVRDTDGDDKQ